MSDMDKCEKCIHQYVCEKRTCAECVGGYCDECELYNCYGGKASVKNCSDFIDRDNVKEVKHGHWIDKKVKHPTSSGGTGTTPYRECSVCGWDYPVITVGQHFKPYKNCPECTARMDGDNNQ